MNTTTPLPAALVLASEITTSYYARVIEIPTPRWTARDQVRFGIKMSDDVPIKQQGRDWTWPILYTPSS
jgi:hypothetical protein